MPLVFEADGDAVAGEGPERLLQAILVFLGPLALEELDDFAAAVQELGAVAPFGVFSVGERNAFRVARVPSVFSGLDLLSGSLLDRKSVV